MPNDQPARPIRIGITCDFETIVDRRGCSSPRYVLSETYSSAVERAGGQPLLLTHLAPEAVPGILELFDGIVISGGEADVPPSFYGEETRPATCTPREQRSSFERALARAAIRRGTPLLGVCGGMQLLNVALGGSLYQDLSELNGCGEHRQPHDKSKPQHFVNLAADSKLRLLTGCERLAVNSTHHQMVRRLGEGLIATAQADDGVIEGLELSSHPFVIGVQWHPEAMVEAEQGAIYRGLIEAAARAAERRC